MSLETSSTAIHDIAMESAMEVCQDTYQRMQDLFVAMEALEEIKEKLTPGEGKTVSQESVATTTDALNVIYGAIGLESIPSDATAEVALESIEISLERISEGLGKAWAMMKASYVRLFHPLWMGAKVNMARMASLASKASEARSQGGHEVRISAKYLGRDNQHKDLFKYYSTVVTTLDELIERFPEHAAECFLKNRNSVIAMDIKNADGWDAAADRVLQKWDDPRKTLTKEQLELVYPNGSRLFIDEPGKYRGSDKVAKAFDDLAFKNYPTVSGSTDTAESGRGTVTVKALSSEQIRTLASKFRTALSHISLLESFLEKNYGELTSLLRTGTLHPDSLMSAILGKTPNYKLWGHKKAEINTLYAAVRTGYELFNHMPFDAGRVLNQSTGIFVRVANECLKYGKPSNESHSEGDRGTDDNVSLEGYGIKLRTGMRVKYSGGYGKIVKIFDRPTKYKGEIHHCTKDNPKYEVKSDVGNKLSLHKGGALTPY